jgi:hypothetical protein
LLDQGDHLQVGPLVFEVHLQEEVAERPPSITDAGAVTLGDVLETKRDKATGQSHNNLGDTGQSALDQTRSSPALAPKRVEATPDASAESSPS